MAYVQGRTVSLRECTNWEKHRKVANPRILPSHIKGIIYINHETRILSFTDFMECAIRGRLADRSKWSEMGPREWMAKNKLVSLGVISPRNISGVFRAGPYSNNWWLSGGPLCMQPRCFSRWWQLKYFLFSPWSLGKWSNLTSIFFRWVETTNYR